MATGRIILILAAIIVVSLAAAIKIESTTMLAYMAAVGVLAFVIMATHERPSDPLRRWRPFSK